MCDGVIMSSFVSLCLLRHFHPWATLRRQPIVFPPRCAFLVALSLRPQQIISLPPRCSVFPSGHPS